MDAGTRIRMGKDNKSAFAAGAPNRETPKASCKKRKIGKTLPEKERMTSPKGGPTLRRDARNASYTAVWQKSAGATRGTPQLHAKTTTTSRTATKGKKQRKKDKDRATKEELEERMKVK